MNDYDSLKLYLHFFIFAEAGTLKTHVKLFLIKKCIGNKQTFMRALQSIE